VSVSDWLVLGPWIAFALGLIIFYIWLRRPPKPPCRRARHRPRIIGEPGPPPDERQPLDHGTESDRQQPSP
jgi:hypothetical protein